MDNSRAVDGSSRSTSNGPLNVLVLKHVKGRTNEKGKDVTTLDWNVSFISLYWLKFIIATNYALNEPALLFSYTIKVYVKLWFFS